MNSGENINPEEEETPKEHDIMDEAHQELKESKDTVRDLISYRRNAFKNDQVKMDEYLDKAIDAINNLFNDELPPDNEPA